MKEPSKPVSRITSSHLGPNPLDLAEADLVDLLGRQVEGGEPADLFFVVRPSARQIGGAQRLSRVRLILADEEVEEPLVGRRHRLVDRGLGLGQDPLPVHLFDRLRQVLERGPEGAVLRLVCDVGRDRVLVAVEHYARQAEAALEPGAHVALLLLEEGRQCPHPGDVVVVVIRGPERHRAVHARKPHVETGVRVERHLVLAELEALHAAPELALEHPRVDPVRRAEPVEMDLLEPPQEIATPFDPALDRLQAGVGQLVVPAVVADTRRELRTLDEPSRPVLVEEGVELFASVRGRRTGDQCHHGQYRQRRSIQSQPAHRTPNPIAAAGLGAGAR